MCILVVKPLYDPMNCLENNVEREHNRTINNVSGFVTV